MGSSAPQWVIPATMAWNTKRFGELRFYVTEKASSVAGLVISLKGSSAFEHEHGHGELGLRGEHDALPDEHEELLGLHDDL